ncbi:hypothetical protein ACG74X_09100 [Marivita sp. S0852]|uniref:hypothetical protein n=1 Tax=Marivita sp. S0852 TaxID=3373893 RepID=UPI003981C3E8
MTNIHDDKKGELSFAFSEHARPILTVDVERYQSYLDDTDMTDEQKQAFIEALWSIVVCFVDLGFGVHPLQEVCGQNDEKAISDAPSIVSDVYLEHSDNDEQDELEHQPQ